MLQLLENHVGRRGKSIAFSRWQLAMLRMKFNDKLKRGWLYGVRLMARQE